MTEQRPDIRERLADYWRANGLTEEEIAEAQKHLIVEYGDGTITLSWDDPEWRRFLTP